MQWRVQAWFGVARSVSRGGSALACSTLPLPGQPCPPGAAPQSQGPVAAPQSSKPASTHSVAAQRPGVPFPKRDCGRQRRGRPIGGMAHSRPLMCDCKLGCGRPQGLQEINPPPPEMARQVVDPPLFVCVGGALDLYAPLCKYCCASSMPARGGLGLDPPLCPWLPGTPLQRRAHRWHRRDCSMVGSRPPSRPRRA